MPIVAVVPVPNTLQFFTLGSHVVIPQTANAE
jgi:hypothetical protein